LDGEHRGLLVEGDLLLDGAFPVRLLLADLAPEIERVGHVPERLPVDVAEAEMQLPLRVLELEPVGLAGGDLHLLRLRLRDEHLVAGMDEVWVRPLPLEVGVAGMVVDDPEVGEAVPAGDLREALALPDGVLGHRRRTDSWSPSG